MRREQKSEQWLRRVVRGPVAYRVRVRRVVGAPAARSTFFESFKRPVAQRPSMRVQPMERVDVEETEAAPLPDWFPQSPAPIDTGYEGRSTACGRCDACAERIASFRDNGVCDQLEYEVDIAW